MSLDDIIKEVAQELDLPFEVCRLAYTSAWKFMYEKISEMSLKGIDAEEFKTLRTNFNMPSLGKFYVTEETRQKTQRRIDYMEKYVKEVKDDKSKRH